ncbi:ATP-binding protein [Thalassomonas sp. M1454]|uniref:ATP-binding protein n=1 Tax=Thalassomonas sp. M1454 TaxID=2594477 RepID=UPI001181382E|nr:ATP-binding protein [Thalassomonas sp. M1454]TRX57917.1 HAMP domain-containing protein [Thalassomonas sp. M1454]
MFLNRLKATFSSLKVKIFLGFWIIAIITMSITQWVTEQYNENEKIIEITKADQLHLQLTAKKLVRNFSKEKLRPIDGVLIRSRNIPRGIWLKDPKTNRLHSNTAQLPFRIPRTIKELEFSHAVDITIPGYNLIGPQEVVIRDKTYHLFIGKIIQRKDIPQFLQQMPDGLRVFMVLVITGMLCWVLSWYLIRPLKKLTSATKLIGKGELATRLPEFENRFDEVGQLGQALNGMADKLEHSIAAQQRLLGDISHELRSPLTRMQLSLSMIEKVQHNNPTLDKYIVRVATETSRLDNMISQALQLSRLESQLQQMHNSTFNLSSLLESLIDDAQFVGNEKSISIKADIIENIKFFGDHQLLSSAIENILNNALRYSINDSQISVSLKLKNHKIRIIICDQGPGVDVKYIKDIFKPFFRTSEARDRISGGTGLGLAIASRAIHCHQGHIYAKLATTSNENPGLCVIMTLPQATDTPSS